jgi:alkylated DNA repair dioxygenase AlkB
LEFVPDALTTADLFAAPPLPGGLEYHAGFLMPREETALLELFAKLPFREALFREYTARRRIVRFGCDYDPGNGTWNEVAPLPPLLAALRRKVAAFRGFDEHDYLHALVTEYRPGTPIGWHRDRPRYGIVVGLSLGGAVRMRFRPCERPNDRAAVIALELVPRSLYVMQGEVRWRWQHSIPPAKALRYSITLRTLADVATSRAPPSASRA